MAMPTSPVASHAVMFIVGLMQGYFLHYRSAAPDPRNPLVPARTTQSGEVVCEVADFECGEKNYGDRIEHVFVLRNTGDEPVYIESVRADSGLECTVDVKTIPPARHARLKARMLVRGPAGKFHHQISVATNAARSPVVKLQLVGHLLPEASVEPRQLLLGAFRAAAPPARKFQVQIRNPREYQVAGVRVNNPMVVANLEEGSRHGRYAVQVQARPEQHFGPFQCLAQVVAEHQGITRLFGTTVHGYSLADPDTLPPERKICQLKPGTSFTVSGRTVDGRFLDPFSFGGQPVVLAFWASWDPLSVAALRELDQYCRNDGLDQFRVVGHAVDSQLETALAAIAENDIRCPILFNEPDETGIPLVLKRHKILALPVLILIDSDGKIREVSSSIQPIQQSIAAQP